MARADAGVELLDAAERLFAEQGIAAVSDRGIAVAAGHSNHSAVGYHFGGRAGLLRALLDRHLESVEPARAEMLAASTTLLGDVRALVIPVTTTLAQLPTPSWRARFLQQVFNDPAAVELLRTGGAWAQVAVDILQSVTDRLNHLDRSIVEGRGRLMNQLLVMACAGIEKDAEAGSAVAPWSEAGDFLCDAIAGMLQAPVSADSER